IVDEREVANERRYGALHIYGRFPVRGKEHVRRRLAHLVEGRNLSGYAAGAHVRRLEIVDGQNPRRRSDEDADERVGLLVPFQEIGKRPLGVAWSGHRLQGDSAPFERALRFEAMVDRDVAGRSEELIAHVVKMERLFLLPHLLGASKIFSLSGRDGDLDAAGNREAVALVLIAMKMGMQNPLHLRGPDFAELLENAARSEIDQQRPAVLDQSVDVAGVFKAEVQGRSLAVWAAGP